MGVGENSEQKNDIEGDETTMAAIASEENSSKKGNANGARERTSKSNEENNPFYSKLPLTSSVPLYLLYFTFYAIQCVILFIYMLNYIHLKIIKSYYYESM